MLLLERSSVACRRHLSGNAAHDDRMKNLQLAFVRLMVGMNDHRFDFIIDDSIKEPVEYRARPDAKLIADNALVHADS